MNKRTTFIKLPAFTVNKLEAAFIATAGACVGVIVATVTFVIAGL